MRLPRRSRVLLSLAVAGQPRRLSGLPAAEMALHLARCATSDAHRASPPSGIGGDAARRRRTLSSGAAPIAAGVDWMGDSASALGRPFHSRPAPARGAHARRPSGFRRPSMTPSPPVPAASSTSRRLPDSSGSRTSGIQRGQVRRVESLARRGCCHVGAVA